MSKLERKTASMDAHAIAKRTLQLDNQLGKLFKETQEEYKGKENREKDIQREDENIETANGKIFARLEEIKSRDEQIQALREELEEMVHSEDADPLQSALWVAATSRRDEGFMTEKGWNANDASSRSAARVVNPKDAILVALARAVAELKNISHLTDTSFVQRARGKQNTSLVTVDDPGLGFFSVDVEWNYNACSFVVSPKHSFEELLLDAVSYWSLEPTKHVLVNESKVMWPSTANVRDAVRSFAAQNMGAKPMLRLYNREREVAKKFAWLEGRAKDGAVEESKENETGYGEGYFDNDDIARNTESTLEARDRRDREGGMSGDAYADDAENEKKGAGIVSSIVDMLTCGSFPISSSPLYSSNTLAASAEGAAVRPQDSIIREDDINVIESEEDIRQGDKYDEFETDQRILRQESGTDIVKAATTEIQHGEVNDIQFFRHLEMFVFLLFIVIYSNTMFMRRQVYQAHFVHEVMAHTFFGQAITNTTHNPSGISFQSKTTDFRKHREKFVEAETEYLSYDDIDSVDGIWRWLEGPVRSATTGAYHGYDTGSHHSNSLKNTFIVSPAGSASLNKTGISIVNRFNVLVGPVRLIQHRAASSSCKTAPDRHTVALARRVCYSKFAPSGPTESNASYGPAMQLPSPSFATEPSKLASPFYYTNSVNNSNFNDLVPAYMFDHYIGNPIGGFVADLSTSVDEFDAQVQYLKRNVWIDSQTRAVRLVATYYNVNIKYFAVVLGQIDITDTGNVQSWKEIRMLRLVDVDNDPNESITITRRTMEVFTGAIVLLNIFVIVTKILIHASSAGKSEVGGQAGSCNDVAQFVRRIISIFWIKPWLNADVIFICAGLLAGVMRLYFFNISVEWMKSVGFINSPTRAANDITFLVYVDWWTNVTDSIVLVAVLFRSLQFFEFNPHVALLFRVISLALPSFLHFLLMFGIVLSTFVVIVIISLGSHLDQYTSVSYAYARALKTIMGLVEYPDFVPYAGSYEVGVSLMYGLLLVTGYFFMRNMFLAILYDAYRRVAEDVRRNGFYWMYTEESRLSTTFLRAVDEEVNSGNSRRPGHSKGENKKRNKKKNKRGKKEKSSSRDFTLPVSWLHPSIRGELRRRAAAKRSQSYLNKIE